MARSARQRAVGGVERVVRQLVRVDVHEDSQLPGGGGLEGQLYDLAYRAPELVDAPEPCRGVEQGVGTGQGGSAVRAMAS